MKDRKIATIATELAAPLVEAMGLVLWGVEFRGSGGGKNVLRLFVDANPNADAVDQTPDTPSGPDESGPNDSGVGDPGGQDFTSDNPPLDDTLSEISKTGVSIGQCARLSRDLGLALEVEDAIPGAYTLEVSSPGLERRFFTTGQMAEYVGKNVRVDLYEGMGEPFPGRKRLGGKLVSIQGDDIHLEVDGESITTSFKAAKRAQLVHRFDGPRPKEPKKKKKKKK